MIYSHKPQRSGKSIPTNTNTPPQDPPPPPVPDILIEDSTPPVPEVCTHEKPIKTPKAKPIKVPKKTKPIPVTWRNRIVRFFKKIFRR